MAPKIQYENGIEDTLISSRSSLELSPYRSSSFLLKEKKKAGLLLMPDTPKLLRHTCRTPSIFWRNLLCFWLPSIKEGDLWRCPQCLTFYGVEAWCYDGGSGISWEKISKQEDGMKAWKELGGDE